MHAKTLCCELAWVGSVLISEQTGIMGLIRIEKSGPFGAEVALDQDEGLVLKSLYSLRYPSGHDASGGKLRRTIVCFSQL